MTNPPRSSGHDITELHTFITDLVASINYKYGNPSTNYVPVHYLERHVPLHERMAFYRCVVWARSRLQLCFCWCGHHLRGHDLAQSRRLPATSSVLVPAWLLFRHNVPAFLLSAFF